VFPGTPGNFILDRRLQQLPGSFAEQLLIYRRRGVRTTSCLTVINYFPYTTDTRFKVTHIGGKNRADKSITTAADVSNFAGANDAIVDTALWTHSLIGSRNLEPVRSYTTCPKRASERAPAGSRRGVKKSERTTSCEDFRISSTNDAPAPGITLDKNGEDMKKWNEFTHFAGIDWAKNKHEVVIVDPSGKIVAQSTLSHDSAGWQTWQRLIASYRGLLAVCVETNQGAVIERLLQSDCSVYPVHPPRAKQYRQRKISSGNKTDFVDAWALADALRMDGHVWRALKPTDSLINELRLLCRDEVAFIEERTALVNRLQQALYEYYPGALEAFGEWTLPSAWAFVERFPTPELLIDAGKRKWEKFLHTHRLAHPKTFAKRLEIFSKADQFLVRPEISRAKSRQALTLIKMLRTLESQLDAYRQEIERLFAQHPDSTLYGSLPGVGQKLGPRLLGEIGSDRSMFSSSEALQCVAGTAPVSYQSGQVHKVYLRRHCNKFLRHTVHLWADPSRARSPWAQAYYHQQRSLGRSHACAIRTLGQRWLKILWKMWTSNTSYDPDFHTKNQLKHGSWVLKLLTNENSTSPCQ
jgi:transposase